MNKNKLVNFSIIFIFVFLYLCVSVISTIHVVDFFKLTNPTWLAISLAVAFEIGAAASLASLIILEKMNKSLVWALFITLTLFQSIGNVYFAYSNAANFTSWAELFGLVDKDLIMQKRILASLSGAILPLVALGFIKSLVDYIKPDEVSQPTHDKPIIETAITEEPVIEKIEPQIIERVVEPIQEEHAIEEQIIEPTQEEPVIETDNESLQEESVIENIETRTIDGKERQIDIRYNRTGLDRNNREWVRNG